MFGGGYKLCLEGDINCFWTIINNISVIYLCVEMPLSIPSRTLLQTKIYYVSESSHFLFVVISQFSDKLSECTLKI